MRRILCLLALLSVAACYQVEGDVVPAAQSRQAQAIADGSYRRPDGALVELRWNGAANRYDVTGAGSPGGTAQAMPVGRDLYVVQYQDAARLAVLARVQGSDLVLLTAPKPDEARLAKAHGLAIRPGPINILAGPPAAIAAYFKDLADLPGLVEGGRLERVNTAPR